MSANGPSQPAPLKTYCQRCSQPVSPDDSTCASCTVERARAGWPSDDMIGREVGGKYHILKRLGAGGFGVVYLARHQEFEALRAIKVLHERLTYDDKIVRRFHREARAIYRLSAPNIVRLEDFGEIRKGVPYMALEFAPGRTLNQLLNDEGPLPPRRALGIARQLAIALVDANSEGVLHRDLKPHNIVVNEHPHRGDEVKVLDFGVAKILDEHTMSLTDNSLAGTPEYMAPEQWRAAQDIDARADLFAVGVILFEMVTGAVPFKQKGGDPFTVLSQLKACPAPPISECVPGRVPKGMDDLVASLLAENPDDRPPSAAEVVKRIDAMKVLSTGAVLSPFADLDAEQRNDQVAFAETTDLSVMAARPETEIELTPASMAKKGPSPSSVESSSRRRVTLLTIFALGGLLGSVWLLQRTERASDDRPVNTSASNEVESPGEPPDIVTTPDPSVGQEPSEPFDVGSTALAPDAEAQLSNLAPDGMLWIPGGISRLGQSQEQLTQQAEMFVGPPGSYLFLEDRDLVVDGFFIDQYEVTVNAYTTFLDGSAGQTASTQFGALCPAHRRYQDRTGPTNNPLEPIRGVSFHEARLFCDAADRRLPTFEEWERAARGDDSSLDVFPWHGGLDRAGAYNGGAAAPVVYSREISLDDGFSELAPVTATAAGQSEFGVEGMAGNVSEWVLGPQDRDLIPPFFHRGGSFQSHPVFLQTFAYQFLADPCQGHEGIGFRCARSPVSEESL